MSHDQRYVSRPETPGIDLTGETNAVSSGMIEWVEEKIGTTGVFETKLQTEKQTVQLDCREFSENLHRPS